MFEKTDLSTFLHFGYLPRVPQDVSHQPWAKARIHALATHEEVADESEMIAQGVCALKKAFENPGDGPHVIPLSGGLDSRAILGGLLEAGLKDRITTVTFGTPGTFDYDIGCEVANQMAVRHESLDLTKIKLEQQAFEDTARDIGTWVWLFDAFYNRLISERFSKDVSYWSGFMGEALSGVHLSGLQPHTWGEAKAHFARWNRFATSISLAPSGFQPEEVLRQSPYLDSQYLGYDDQLDFTIRQECYIKPVVITKGYDYRTPFLHPDWVSFILSVPRRYRENQYLYKEILKRRYPKVFSLPTKNNRGLPLDAPKWRSSLRRLSLGACSRARRIVPRGPWGIDPRINYIDFDRGLRERDDLKTLVYENIQDLKRRSIVDWIDIDAIWKRHQRRQANHADALTLLASLEINLKAKQSIS